MPKYVKNIRFFSLFLWNFSACNPVKLSNSINQAQFSTADGMQSIYFSQKYTMCIFVSFLMNYILLNVIIFIYFF